MANSLIYGYESQYKEQNYPIFMLQNANERYKSRCGHYPERILPDKIYCNRRNLSFCKERGIRLRGPTLGRTKQGQVHDKKQNFRDKADWVEDERQISLTKRKCGMGLITTRLESNVVHSIALSVLLLNIRKAVILIPDVGAIFTLAVWAEFQIGVCSVDSIY